MTVNINVKYSIEKVNSHPVKSILLDIVKLR